MITTFNEIVPRIAEHLRMSTALGVAQEVQQSLLPKDDPTLQGFDISGSSVYCDETDGIWEMRNEIVLTGIKNC